MKTRAIIAFIMLMGAVPARAAFDPSLQPNLNAVRLSSYLGAADPVSAADTAAGSSGYVYLDASVTLTQAETLSASWIGSGGVITLGTHNATFAAFNAPPTVKSFNENSSGVVSITKEVCVSPLWWGADPTNVTDSTDAFNDAVASDGTVCVPAGTYNIAGTITVQNGQSMVLDPTAILNRHASGATTPMLYVLYNGGFAAGTYYTSTNFSGGQIIDQSDSPNGVVVLGNKNNTDTNTAWWWRFSNVSVSGLSNANDINILVPSGQYNSGSGINYFGTISNVNIFGGDVCLEFADYANGNHASNLNFWNCKTYAVELKGAYGNSVTDFYIHTGAASGLIGIALVEPTSGTFYTRNNYLSHFNDESGGGADKTVSISTNSSGNYLLGTANTSATGTISNQSNFVVINGSFTTSVPPTTFTANGVGNAINWVGSTVGGYLYSGTTFACVSDGTGCTNAALTLGTSSTSLYSPNESVHLDLTNSTTGITGIPSGAASAALCYNSGTGAITYDTAGTICGISDARVKNVLGALPAKPLSDLVPKVFNFKDPKKYEAGEHVGFIAQDVCKLDERLCVHNSDGTMNYDERGLIAYLWADEQGLRGLVKWLTFIVIVLVVMVATLALRRGIAR